MTATDAKCELCGYIQRVVLPTKDGTYRCKGCKKTVRDPEMLHYGRFKTQS